MEVCGRFSDGLRAGESPPVEPLDSVLLFVIVSCRVLINALRLRLRLTGVRVKAGESRELASIYFSGELRYVCLVVKAAFF